MRPIERLLDTAIACQVRPEEKKEAADADSPLCSVQFLFSLGLVLFLLGFALGACLPCDRGAAPRQPDTSAGGGGIVTPSSRRALGA